MHVQDMYELEEAINKIANVTNTEPREVIESLTGIAWDEEIAGDISTFMKV